ncbi:SDR family NAD(P)-dependent oxidoreductase, partial [Escherichia coli]
MKVVLYGIVAVLLYMKAHNSGQFINVSSVAGHKSGAGEAVYAGIK